MTCKALRISSKKHCGPVESVLDFGQNGRVAILSLLACPHKDAFDGSQSDNPGERQSEIHLSHVRRANPLNIVRAALADCLYEVLTSLPGPDLPVILDGQTGDVSVSMSNTRRPMTLSFPRAR